MTTNPNYNPSVSEHFFSSSEFPRACHRLNGDTARTQLFGAAQPVPLFDADGNRTSEGSEDFLINHREIPKSLRKIMKEAKLPH